MSEPTKEQKAAKHIADGADLGYSEVYRRALAALAPPAQTQQGLSEGLEAAVRELMRLGLDGPASVVSALAGRDSPTSQAQLRLAGRRDGWSDLLLYWLLRADRAYHHEGWKGSAPAEEAFTGILCVLCNVGADPTIRGGKADSILSQSPIFSPPIPDKQPSPAAAHAQLSALGLLNEARAYLVHTGGLHRDHDALCDRIDAALAGQPAPTEDREALRASLDRVTALLDEMEADARPLLCKEHPGGGADHRCGSNDAWARARLSTVRQFREALAGSPAQRGQLGKKGGE